MVRSNNISTQAEGNITSLLFDDGASTNTKIPCAIVGENGWNHITRTGWLTIFVEMSLEMFYTDDHNSNKLDF